MAKEVSANNDCGVFALISAILSVIFSATVFPIGFVSGFVFGILALIFGIRQARVKRNAWSTSAVILAIIGIIIGLLVLYVEMAVIGQMANSYAQMQSSGAFDQAGAYAQ